MKQTRIVADKMRFCGFLPIDVHFSICCRLTAVCVCFILACGILSAQTVRVTAVGDIMAHLDLQHYAQTISDGYKSIYGDLIHYFLDDDLTIANLEVPICDSRPVSGYPRFNAHSDLTEAVASSGIELVSLANNHAYDQTADGVIGTLEAVSRAGLMANGIGIDPAEAMSPLYFEIKGIRFAFISVTFSVNNIKMPKADGKPYVHIIDMYGTEYSDSEMELLQIVRDAKTKTDAVIVALHFGEEYTYRPSDKDTVYLNMIAESGADVILGSHPHVLHKSAAYRTQDGRDAFIVKSLGNFVSGQARYFSRKHLTFDKLKDCVEIRTAESAIVKFDIVMADGKIKVLSKSMIPVFNIRFPIDDGYGYLLTKMTSIIDNEITDERIIEMPDYELLRRLVRFRYRHLPGVTELPYF